MTFTGSLLLAPLRGVTIRTFRRVFAEPLAEAGFSEALTPFIPALPGLDPLADRELASGAGNEALAVTPQFIGKDPAAFADALRRVRDAGYATADLNAGCPFPMVRNKGRGSGLLRNPDTLRRMLDAGCATLGANRLSLKTRLGVERPDELLALTDALNGYPLRFLTVHARTARQMYAGSCDEDAFRTVVRAAKMPILRNGDAPLPADGADLTEGGALAGAMVGRAFLRALAARDDIGALVARYAAASAEELHGERPVLGRLKELVAYWKDLPGWNRRWSVLKLCRTSAEFLSLVTSG